MSKRKHRYQAREEGFLFEYDVDPSRGEVEVTVSIKDGGATLYTSTDPLASLGGAADWTPTPVVTDPETFVLASDVRRVALLVTSKGAERVSAEISAAHYVNNARRYGVTQLDAA